MAKQIPLYFVDAFTAEPFRGNPASVLLLDEDLPDTVMAAVASEMNQTETAFARKTGEGTYSLRWFTPKVEVDLCGHATLGTAAALFTESGETAPTITFETRSGKLHVSRGATAGSYVMDFPAQTARPAGADPAVLEALHLGEIESYHATPRSFVVVEVPQTVDLTTMKPDFDALGKITLPKEGHAIIVTRRGPEPYDFTSRMFAPWLGINEDPVTGAAHTVLTPFWSERLGKTEMRAFQSSPRGGEINVRLKGNRVDLVGRAVTVVRGTISV